MSMVNAPMHFQSQLNQIQHGQQLLIASAKQAEQDRLSSYINNSIGIQSRFSAAMQKPSNQQSSHFDIYMAYYL
jgi:hypothetical protein